jgi:predicted nuclease of predicted toxin-antitoxin system
MSYRMLADENVQRQVCRYLRKQGHDAVMVVDELRPGVDDTAVVEQAGATDRVALTHDTDYFVHDHPRCSSNPRSYRPTKSRLSSTPSPSR